MGKLIAVVGNVGVGKTTFARQLSQVTGFQLALENHHDRAFHAEFATSRATSAIGNQIDYLLFRAEQEEIIRSDPAIAITDGGLEQDFFVFTRYFAHIGALSPQEYALCERLYHFIRRTLPPPDLLVHLSAPTAILMERYARRNRALEVIKPADIPIVEKFVQDWLHQSAARRVIHVDVSADDPECARSTDAMLASIRARLGLAETD